MILTDISKFDQERLTLLTYKIKETKANYDAYLADTDSYLKGSRYNDDARIARMVVGNIYGECKFDHVEASKKFLSLNSIEIEPYIKAAVLDSASADHWYTYEKQW
jgi:hypothetical protein